ncbi:myotubularin isoform X2 [Nematostella vectensis]|uniref:myotubularin isoform X2 n=1 Tax=Nematostella vectensis TaxID=45351 RepID=UPI002076D636|nr:myotubularin isoform X2 [Nematostella vectensis]
MITACMISRNRQYKGSFDKRKLKPFQGPLPSRLYSHPPLYPGEQIILQQDHVTCIDSFDSYAQGVLHLTTYRVLFTGVYARNYLDGLKEAYQVNAEDDAEELSRHGSQRQSFSATGKHMFVNGNNNIHDWSRQQRILRHVSNKARNGLRYTQSLKKRSCSTLEAVPGRVDECSARLQKFKPLIFSNLEQIEHQYSLELSVPCTCIYEIRKFSRKNIPKGNSIFMADGVELLCSNIQSHRFCLGLQDSYDADSLIKLLMYHTKPLFPRLFAFAYKTAILMPPSCNILDTTSAPNFYKFNDEFQRLGLLSLSKWRIPSHQCMPYPTQTLVPSTISDAELNTVAVFHKSSCFPTVCWQHPENGVALLRSSAVVNRRGLLEGRCEHDETMLTSICDCNENSNKAKLVVFTEQPKPTASGLQITGQLTPEQGETFYYPNCKFVYADSPPDFKAVRQSACKLQAFLASKGDDSKYLSQLEETEWLTQLSELLQTATQAAVAMDCDKSSVLFSYEDGCDRTAQVSSLVQVMLDPYYRTLDGFQVLIQKEWLSFGHKFADRILPPETNPESTEEHGPVFLQWLDCVWQLTQQYPFSFQFNEYLLKTIAESAYSSRFGTFLANSSRDREEEEIDERTASLWTWLNVVTMDDPDCFINPRYQKNASLKLFPRYHIACLKLWTSCYSSQFKQENLREAHKAGRVQEAKLEEQCKDLLAKHAKLLLRLAEKDSLDTSSRPAFCTASLQHQPANHLVLNFTLGSGDDDREEGSSPDGSLASVSSGYDSLTRYQRPLRRMTRSRSLDDMLDAHACSRSNRTTKRQSLKRKVGGSKFYTDKFLSDLQKEPRSRVTDLPISEKYSSLQDYLNSTGVDFDSESTVTVGATYCCGYMVKQGQVRKNWKKRWFVLDFTKKYLAYFETEKTQHPKGAISYQSILEVYEHRKTGRRKKCLFCLDTPNRTYTIESPNERSMQIWMACLTVPLSAIEVRPDR